MNILTLQNNLWKKLVNPNITNEEKEILTNLSEDNQSQRQQTTENIVARSTIDASTEESSFAQELYDQHKINNAILIDVQIFYPDGGGIINCRIGQGIDSEHKQIRF